MLDDEGSCVFVKWHPTEQMDQMESSVQITRQND